MRLIVGANPDTGELSTDDNTHYQLTHDYLVPSIKDWLAREMKSTWQGRAELNLRDLSNQWRFGNQKRFLPGIRDLAAMECGIRKSNLGGFQVDYLRAARRLHFARFGMVAMLLVAFLSVQAYFRAIDHRNQLVDQFLGDSTFVAKQSIEELGDRIKYGLDRFDEVLASENSENRDRVRARLGRFLVSKSDADFIDLIAEYDNDRVAGELDLIVYAGRVKGGMDWSCASKALVDKPISQKIVFSAIQVASGQTSLISQDIIDVRHTENFADQEAAVCPTKDLSNSTQLIALIDQMVEGFDLPEQHDQWASEIYRQCDSEENATRLFFLMIFAREVEFELLDSQTKSDWEKWLRQQFRNHPDSGVHSMCQLLARRFELDFRSEIADLARPKPAPGMNWWIVEVTDSSFQTFAKISPGTYRQSESIPDGFKENRHQLEFFPIEVVTIAKPFWLSTEETTTRSILHWAKQEGIVSSEWEKQDPSNPAIDVSLDDGMGFTNWLNPQCIVDSKYKFDIPTALQWEFACRAGSKTRFSFGGTDQLPLISKFAFVESRISERLSLDLPGTLIPNRLGVFDMFGNVPEVTKLAKRHQEIYSTLKAKSPTRNLGMFVRGGGTGRNPNLFSGYQQGLPGDARFAGAGIRLMIQFKKGE